MVRERFPISGGGTCLVTSLPGWSSDIAELVIREVETPILMTPLTPNPVLIDDAELLHLIATPRQRLFSSLNRASAFTPLIVVCCALPAFLLLSHNGLNEIASMWGLRSLAVANANSLEELLQPGLNDAGQPLLFQPPLAAWLNGFVVRILGPAHPLSPALVSLLATGAAIWLVTRCAWRIGGANTALISALLMCSHPQVLESSVVPTNTAIGTCLFLASVFGLQRHLERKTSLLSPSLLLSSITWGFTFLAIGPIALSLPLVFILFNWTSRRTCRRQPTEPAADCVTGCWTSKRSLLIFICLGLLVGGWWEVMMLSKYGLAFWQPWWACVPKECLAGVASEWLSTVCPLLQQSGGEWIVQTAMVLGWMLIGLHRTLRERRHSENDTARHRFQLLLLWWAVMLAGRILAEIMGMVWFRNTSIWNVALVTPTILLASLGFGTVSERLISRRGEGVLIVLVVGLIVWRLTLSELTSVIAGGVTATILLFGPIVGASSRQTQSGWSEGTWRHLMRVTVYGSLLACLSAGLGLRTSRLDDETRLAHLKERLITLPDVRRISLVASRDPIPVALSYLLRCRWPHAEMVSSEGWDVGMSNAMEKEGQMPASRFLVLEWTRREIRMSADASQYWQMSAVGEPMRFYGRRLSLVLIEPKT